MRETIMKRTTVMILVLSFLLALVPMTAIHTEAAESTSGTPALNETLVGTVDFQAFNFLGNSNEKEDGIDYCTTFYYTDDYFAPSAVNTKAEETGNTSLQWYDLEDTSMATASFDFAVSAFNTNVRNVVPSMSSNSWENTDYTNKHKNAKSFLEFCRFEDVTPYEYDHAPTRDSIGCVLAHKNITVYDETTKKNKEFTVVAVGVRGAGYGAEWASNVTIGDPNDPEDVQRHQGFAESADTVCDRIQSYTREHGITENVKYWVVGFSRAAAVANLAAGNLTDEADAYHTTKNDIYGYTYECPQGAAIDEDAGYYTNIHNIINGMDAVPKVSPDEFEHQRLGYDYYMPYYKNAGDKNGEYYQTMRDVITTIIREDDPLWEATDPANYPYDRPLPIYEMTAWQLTQDAFQGKLKDNFGTVEYDGSRKLGNGQWYIDEYIDNLIDVFLVSPAWDREYGNTPTTNKELVHRKRFIETYQEDFRTLFGYLMDYSGPGFMMLVDDIIAQVQEQLAVDVDPLHFVTNFRKLLNNSRFAYAFLRFYLKPNGSYGRFDIGWQSRPTKDVLIEEAQTMVKNIVSNLTAGYSHPNITKAQVNSALDRVTALVIDLYADELDRYESQYFGTTLHYVNEILSTHLPETVMSWNMSVDPNHINRGYRTLTVPGNVDVKLYEFREGIEGAPTANGVAPMVAEVKDGELMTCLDQRISVSEKDGQYVIRYPSMLDLRADLTSVEGDVSGTPFFLSDYMTKTATEGVSAGPDQYRSASTSVYDDITADPGKTNAKAINDSNDMTLGDHDVIQILIHGTSSYDNSGEGDNAVYTVTERDTAAFYGMTLSLDGEISLNIYMDLDEKELKEQGAYMQFTLPGGNHTATEVPLENAVETMIGNRKCYKFSAGVAAKDMTQEITATFIHGDKTPTKTVKTSIKEYCDVIRNDPVTYGEKAVDLVEAMLNYGGYTQLYFNHHTDDLANQDLDLPLKEPTLGSEYTPSKEGECTGLTLRATRAMLTTTTDLRHYFKFSGDEDDYTFTIGDKELEVEEDVSGKYVAVKSIRAKDLDKMTTMVVTNTKDQTRMTIRYSAFSNIKQVLASPSSRKESKDMMTAMYWYGIAAQNYFG